MNARETARQAVKSSVVLLKNEGGGYCHCPRERRSPCLDGPSGMRCSPATGPELPGEVCLPV